MFEIGKTFAKEWIDTVKYNKHTEISKLLDANICFHSPVVYNLYNDKDTVLLILQNVFKVFQDFEYVNDGYVSIKPSNISINQEKENNNLMKEKDNFIGVTLLFKAKVLDIDSGKLINIEGVDIFEVNQFGVAVYLKVIIRPLNGLLALSKQMRTRLLGQSSKL